MPFKKGNTLWKEGIKIKNERRDKLDNFLAILANGGAAKYGDLMDKLANGKPLTKTQIEFMDRFEGWREFVKPKLARTEVGGLDGKNFTVEITNYGKNKATP